MFLIWGVCKERRDTNFTNCLSAARPISRKRTQRTQRTQRFKFFAQKQFAWQKSKSVRFQCWGRSGLAGLAFEEKRQRTGRSPRRFAQGSRSWGAEAGLVLEDEHTFFVSYDNIREFLVRDESGGDLGSDAGIVIDEVWNILDLPMGVAH